jgi:amino acid adenylation domain-containing protein
MSATELRNDPVDCAVAIVGCAGRFPGASNIAAFWKNLCDGVESVRTFADGELEDGAPEELRARPEYVRARGIVDGVDEFDAGFFGMHAREAELIDPQQRIFLECCWQALEDSGCDPATYGGSIGVFAGCSLASYLLRNVLVDRTGLERFTAEYQAAGMPELIGSGYDFLATRVAYKLDLHGPVMTVQSACSTSLLAVAQAAQALMLRQADMMLAGGVSITFPQKRGYLHEAGGMVSADGHCRTFDAGASGTVFGDGCGVVVLKRLEDALADGDSIYSVIRGFGINNDGATKIGYTAPSAEGQAAAIRAAHAMAGFDAGTIGFVECHGTATPLGDPIEVAALTRAFDAATHSKSCALGSLKTNVGHLDVASGVAGLIKAALAVRSGTIPPTLHFTAPNPDIDLSDGPFFINTHATDWPNDAPLRRAAVSSFGLGGTNVHLVLEAAPARESQAASGEAQLLVLSARSESALTSTRANLAAYLSDAQNVRLEDVASTLQTGRRHFPFRAAVAAASLEEAAAALQRTDRIVSGEAREAPIVAFMFPGQGAQYAGMGRDLYLRVPSFRATIDRCADILQPSIGRDLSAVLYGEDAVTITSTEIAQPALFAVEYALAELLREYGIEPVALAGHSVGEFVAAALAGVFSLEDGLALVAERGRLIRDIRPGAMLAVRANKAELGALLDGSLDVAALNSPEMAVVSGSVDAVAQFEAALNRKGIANRKLHTSHAFHSSMMDPVVEPLARRIAATHLKPPSAPYVSGVTGTWITPEQATSPEYWARHCRETVRFSDAVQTLLDAGVQTLVEVGPGSALSTFALQGAAKGGRASVYRSLPGNERERPDDEFLLETLGRLWTSGATLDWNALHAGAARTRVSLPTYPFERTRHWIANAPAPEPLRAADSAPLEVQGATAAEPSGSDGLRREPDGVRRELVALLEDLSGESLAGAPAGASFLELGFDSLFLGRVVQQIRTRFGVSITFRQLLGEIPSIDALSDVIAAHLPAQAAPAKPSGGTSHVEALMAQQLQAMQQLMREQLGALKSLGLEAPAPTAAATTTPERESDAPSRFEAFRVTAAATSEITARQREHIADLIARTVAHTPESKRLTQRYRAVLADPRVAAGFRSEWKEMVYPVTCVRAKGSRLWDVDGNEYIDLLNGFGQTAFGHAPDFVTEAVNAQLERGFAIGPQTDLAGEVAELFCELTGNERMTFCNTGSEAVMAALRVARTVTGRERVVLFEGSYHGQFDEVLVKSAGNSRRSLPVALGIPAEAVANVTVLPYGTPESLAWIREHAAELAAVVVEPVQSRHPALRPVEFLSELRAITEGSGSAFIFDEVVTGFRMHPGGMQAIFGIRADLATYGKVVGGGLPIGILAGKARFMDALDGGAWQFGDDSVPQVAPTFFAGTFVRHPLVMAGVLAVLRHVKAQGPELQERLTERTASLIALINAELERRGIVSRIETYGSLFYVNLSAEDRLAGLLFYHLRLRGIYIQEAFPCFLTTEHTEADVATIVNAVRESLDELNAAGILLGRATPTPAASPASIESALSEEQNEIWLAAQMSDEASCAFNESVTLHLRGRLNERAFEAALNSILGRHEALRASFGTTGERMTIAPVATLALTRDDFSGLPPAERDAAFGELITEDARSAFDLANGPLVRGHLVTFAPEDYAFVFTAHHIVCDGWSMNLILSELAESYEALRRGGQPVLPPAMPFTSYAASQRLRDPAARANVEAYWLEQFSELPPLLELPADRARPALKTFRGASRTALIERDAYLAIKKAGARQGCTLFATLLTAFDVLAGRLSDQNDIVVGVPAAGQAMLEDACLVGHCVDFLPLRARWNRETTLAGLLRNVKQRVLDAYEHQQYTLGTLVRKLAPARETNRTPLAEIQFNLERLADNLAFEELDARIEPNPKAYVNFDLFFNVVESDDGLRIDCDFNSDLFDASTIDRWLNYYRTILEQLGANPEQSVTGFDYRSDADRALLAQLNDSAAAYPRESTVHELFDESASLRAAAPALRCGESVLSYADLRRRANQTAQHLLARIGAPGQRVAVCVARSPELVVALLATLKAGCTYIPLDPSHPASRLRRIIEDAGAGAILSDGSADPAMVPPGTTVVDIRELLAADDLPDGAPSTVVDADAIAYVIYTSGSTGTPKGVAVTHRSVVNLLTSFARTLRLGAGDELLAVTTVSFDIAGLELFLPLLCGATVRVASRDEVADPFALVARLHDPGTSAMQATPALWGMLVEAGFRSRPGLTMLCGGEGLPFDLAQRLLDGGGVLWNVYGPTETTIWSSCVRVQPGAAPITVGKPIANTQFLVLDRNDQPVPTGIAGQLHIAGDGVASGYVGRPDLTAASFVPSVLGEGRMYRTGDAARILSSGEVQVLGRLDYQVKLRGYRIEPGEIEAVILGTSDVAAATVVLREDVAGDKRLVCYYTGGSEAVTEASLRALAMQRLPEYMVPSRWIVLERMPLTAAGKIDRAALPAPDPSTIATEFSPPTTATETALAKIWANVLHLERVGRDDDFLALGGDSIQLFQITARANESGLNVAARELLKHRTVAALARHLDEHSEPSAVRAVAPPPFSARRTVGAAAR